MKLGFSMTKTQQIREDLYCSDCKNCKLIVWNGSSKEMKAMTDRPYIAEHPSSGTIFMVRCGWTKDNVFEPLHLLETEDRLQAGIAGANAAAALPQITMPGQSQVAVALGGYESKQALAVGFSRLSDSGKMTFKTHLNADSEKKFGYGIGVGFNW